MCSDLYFGWLLSDLFCQVQEIYAHQDILIGRDSSRWCFPLLLHPTSVDQLSWHSQYIIDDDFVSNKHLRIYTIVFDEDQVDGVTPLVYAEDLSRNGSQWNGSPIGRGRGGVLLSEGDSIQISPDREFRFHCAVRQPCRTVLDAVQERESMVSDHCSHHLTRLELRPASVSAMNISFQTENWDLEHGVKFLWP